MLTVIIVKLNQFKHTFHANTNRHDETNSLDIMVYIPRFTARRASHLVDFTGGQKWCAGECYSLICPQDSYHLSSLPLTFSNTFVGASVNDCLMLYSKRAAYVIKERNFPVIITKQTLTVHQSFFFFLSNITVL